MAKVRVTGLSKMFDGIVALRNVSLEVADGEFLTLLGPSGCGKSTLLRIIAGLENPDAGTISIGDILVDSLAPSKRNVAMVFQSYALYPHMTVAQNIALPLRMRRLSPWQRIPLLGKLTRHSRNTLKDIDCSVQDVARTLDLNDVLDRKPRQLSGGQRQRVAIARALVRHPSVFLMDEPLSNLDARLRTHTRDEIVQLQRQLHATFIYVTHDQTEAMSMSHRIAVMMSGEILQVSPPQELYDDPHSLRVAEFIGTPRLNCLPGKIRHDGGIEVPGGIIPNPQGINPGSTVTVGIHPESLVINDHPRSSDLKGTVQFIEHLGSEVIVHADIGSDCAPLLIRTRPLLAFEPRPGATIGMRVQKTMIFDSTGRRITTNSAPVSKEDASLSALSDGAQL